MKKVAVINIILLGLITQTGFTQTIVPELRYLSSEEAIEKDTLLQRLRKENIVVILYRTYSAWDYGSRNIAIALGEDAIWSAYTAPAFIGSGGLKPIAAPQDSIIKVWKVFIENELFSLEDEINLVRDCDWYIFDAHAYEIKILTKSAYKRLHYYAPEYFEKACSPKLERQKIIKWASEAWKPFKNFIPAKDFDN